MQISWLVNPVNLKKKRMFSYDTAMTKYKELNKSPGLYTNKKKKLMMEMTLIKPPRRPHELTNLY